MCDGDIQRRFEGQSLREEVAALAFIPGVPPAMAVDHDRVQGVAGLNLLTKRSEMIGNSTAAGRNRRDVSEAIVIQQGTETGLILRRREACFDRMVSIGLDTWQGLFPRFGDAP